jgi:hypothetical protein
MELAGGRGRRSLDRTEHYFTSASTASTVAAATRARKEYLASYDLARQYAYLGDKDATLKLLDLAYHERSPWLVLIQTEPVFDFVHSDRRYHALVEKLGLTPSY